MGVDGEITTSVMTKIKVEEHRERVLLWEQRVHYCGSDEINCR